MSSFRLCMGPTSPRCCTTAWPPTPCGGPLQRYTPLPAPWSRSMNRYVADPYCTCVCVRAYTSAFSWIRRSAQWHPHLFSRSTSTSLLMITLTMCSPLGTSPTGFLGSCATPWPSPILLTQHRHKGAGPCWRCGRMRRAGCFGIGWSGRKLRRSLTVSCARWCNLIGQWTCRPSSVRGAPCM